MNYYFSKKLWILICCTIFLSNFFCDRFLFQFTNFILSLFTTIIIYIVNIFIGSSSINRNIGQNFVQPIDATVQKKRIFDAIAASSIISNCTGVETSQSAATWSVNDLMHFLESRQMITCTEDEARMLIQVWYTYPSLIVIKIQFASSKIIF